MKSTNDNIDKVHMCAARRRTLWVREWRWRRGYGAGRGGQTAGGRRRARQRRLGERAGRQNVRRVAEHGLRLALWTGKYSCASASVRRGTVGHGGARRGMAKNTQNTMQISAWQM